MRSLGEYSKEHPQFVGTPVPETLRDMLRESPPETLVDLGAGDGALLWALREEGLMPATAVAVDLSSERVARAETLSPHIRGIVSDACFVRDLPDESVDAVVSAQVIEHLPDEACLANEISRLLRPNGWWYVSSVLRGPRAWWIYKVHGIRRLDPTHVREYETPLQFRDALQHAELRTRQCISYPCRFPVVDLGLRGLGTVGIVDFETLHRWYATNWILRAARRVCLRPPGYSIIEATGRKAAPT